MKPKFYHPKLANGAWEKLTFFEQMANIGSEVERTINWKNKGRLERSQSAFFRALELMDFSISDARNKKRLKELCRTREVLVDYFFAGNQYGSTDQSWQKYFRAFTWAARK